MIEPTGEADEMDVADFGGGIDRVGISDSITVRKGASSATDDGNGGVRPA